MAAPWNCTVVGDLVSSTRPLCGLCCPMGSWESIKKLHLDIRKGRSGITKIHGGAEKIPATFSKAYHILRTGGDSPDMRACTTNIYCLLFSPCTRFHFICHPLARNLVASAEKLKQDVTSTSLGVNDASLVVSDVTTRKPDPHDEVQTRRHGVELQSFLRSLLNPDWNSLNPRPVQNLCREDPVKV